jgi:DNA-binding transcriptional ArsR family regulator
LQVLSQLKNTHATLEELSVRTQILPSDMARYLSALYYAGAVTADERRAQRSSERSPVGQQSSLPPTLGGPTAPPSVLGDLDVRRDPLDTTAPARLI